MKTRKPIVEAISLESNQPVYTLGVSAQLADIPAHSIRQYIDNGLLIPF